jgi:hypothetical protein
MLDHEPARRDPLQRLGDVLAQLAQLTAAAGAGGRDGIDDALARQMLRQWPACRLATGEGTNRRLGLLRLCRGVRLRSGLLQGFERELQLFDARCALRRGAILLPPQAGDLQLQPLDLDVQDAASSTSLLGLRFRRQPRAALGQDHRVRRGEIGRQQRWRVRHIRNESQRLANAMPFCHPAACGCHVSRGIRQSIPSSR